MYTPEFPDPDERESLANIERYLTLKAQGWYGANAYHVIVAGAGETVVAGAIADYLAEPNAGAIEFLVVSPAARSRGIGRRLLDYTEAALAADARRAGYATLEFIVAEINDPFRVDLAADNMDPFLRARVWGGWGYRRLDFPYVQPALSDDQRPVHHLMLAIKPLGETLATELPVSRLLSTLRAYMRWAMRIPDAEASQEYRAMRKSVAARPAVASVRLDRYVGHDPDVPLVSEEAEGEALDAALAVYARAFPPGPALLEPSAFRRVVAASRSGANAGVHYHLWAVRAEPAAPVAGMASFFTLPRVGFGGYLALGDGLRGRGLLPMLTARIEERMRRDDAGASGWLIECEPDSAAWRAFARLGFWGIALDYRQPTLPGHTAAPSLMLAYKQFGACYGPPALTRADLRAALRSILAIVYRVDDPERSPTMTAAEASMMAWRADVEWRAPPPGMR